MMSLNTTPTSSLFLRVPVMRRLRTTLLPLGALSLSLVLAACGAGGDAAAANTMSGSAPAGTRLPAGAERGATGVEAGSTPADGERSGGSIVLSSADIHTVTRGIIEEGTAISGNLRPIETVNVRARIDGNVTDLHVREGDRVREGTLMAEFERVEQEAALRSAEADELAARTESETAQWDLEQTRDLFKAGAVAERDLRAAEQAAATAAARLAAAESRVRAAATLARDTRVVSPVTGVVERREVESGERVSRGAELFTVVRSDVLELTAAVPARRAGSLERGQVVRFNAGGLAIEGRIARVSPTIDLASQSVTVYVQVPNHSGAIKGNAFATGQIIERSLDGQLVVPQAAIRQSAPAAGGGPFVWKVQGGTLVSAAVKLGIVDEARGVVQVVDGIDAGDDIVVGNVGMLGAGMQVQLIGTENTGVR